MKTTPSLVQAAPEGSAPPRRGHGSLKRERTGFRSTRWVRSLNWRYPMRALTIASVLALTAVAGLGQAEAKGCLKGAVVGGLAGHMVGHGVAGAAAGCASAITARTVTRPPTRSRPRWVRRPRPRRRRARTDRAQTSCRLERASADRRGPFVWAALSTYCQNCRLCRTASQLGVRRPDLMGSLDPGRLTIGPIETKAGLLRPARFSQSGLSLLEPDDHVVFDDHAVLEAVFPSLAVLPRLGRPGLVDLTVTIDRSSP